MQALLGLWLAQAQPAYVEGRARTTLSPAQPIDSPNAHPLLSNLRTPCKTHLGQIN